MSILADFEDRLGRAVEGVFAGAFRSPVQPAEVAKALARAMDDSRLVGVGKVYVPIAYTVDVSLADSKQMGAFSETLAGELDTYLIAYARERQYHLTSRPKVRIKTAEDLKLGRFRVRADAEVKPPEAISPETPLVAPTPSAWDSPVPAEEPSSPPRPVHHIEGLSTVTVGNIHHDVALKGDRVVVGRLAGCDICLEDANVSREHIAFVRKQDGWWVEDLDSTNGTLVNGSPVSLHHLHDGDGIQVGITQLVYHEPKG